MGDSLLTSDARRRASELRAIFWSAALVAAIALLGVLFVPGARVIWVILLFFAVAAVPQGLLLTLGPRSRRRR